MRLTRSIEVQLSSPPKISDLRQLVEQTQDLHDDAVLEIVPISGQRDAVYYKINIENRSKGPY